VKSIERACTDWTWFDSLLTPNVIRGAVKMNEFGQKLQSLRTGRGLTMKELCGMVGIPQSRLSELERGVRIPTSGQIERLENFYEIDAGGLAALAQSPGKNESVAR
jgi:transcriptional regulator with XRE-family HTH domain